MISGPSGVGKGSVVREVLGRDPSVLLSVSCTTRPPREGEQDGADYRFVDDATFDAMVREGAFLEWAEVFGNRYGTPTEPIEQALERGQDVLLEIDVQGARAVRSAVPDAVLIFLVPPSRGELARRLRERGTEDEEALKRRLAGAEAEMAAQDVFDEVVVNEHLDEAAADVAAIIERHRGKDVP